MNLRGVVNIASATLTSGTTYNLACCAAPANQRIAITGFGYFGGFNAAGAAGFLHFARATSQGSSGTTLTPLPLEDDEAETFQSSWLATPSSAPSAITILDTRFINPQLGLTELWGPDDYVMLKGGGFFVMQFIPQQTTNYGGWIRICE
jgi:hypothetical protein